MTTHRFDNTSCSQCGKEGGPGDHGYSHCSDHRAPPSATGTRYTVALDNIRQHEGLLVWEERTVDAVDYDEYLALQQERDQLKTELLAWKHTAIDCSHATKAARALTQVEVTPAVLSEHDLSAYDGWCQSQADGAPPNSDIANLVTAYRALKQERDQLKAAAQQAATALEDILNDDKSDIRKSLIQQSFYARAALADVGIRPTDTHGGTPA